MLESEHWEKNWQDAQTPWDTGGVTPSLVDWCHDTDLRGLDILVPGCGRGYDAHFLSKQAARVVALDYAPAAIEAAQATHPKSRVSWQMADVTALDYKDCFDLIWEYTCFCALDPPLRQTYLAGITRALKTGGRYLGLVFHSFPKPEGPPWPIEAENFRRLLGSNLEIDAFEEDTDRSLKARRGSEIWFSAHKV